MRVSEVMTNNPVCCIRTTSVMTAAGMLREFDIGMLAKRLVGGVGVVREFADISPHLHGMGALDPGEDIQNLVGVAAIRSRATRAVADAKVTADGDCRKSRVDPGERSTARTAYQVAVDTQRLGRVERGANPRAQLEREGPVVAHLGFQEIRIHGAYDKTI